MIFEKTKECEDCYFILNSYNGSRNCNYLVNRVCDKNFYCYYILGRFGYCNDIQNFYKFPYDKTTIKIEEKIVKILKIILF
jgi:hypothetical protein